MADYLVSRWFHRGGSYTDDKVTEGAASLVSRGSRVTIITLYVGFNRGDIDDICTGIERALPWFLRVVPTTKQLSGFDFRFELLFGQ